MSMPHLQFAVQLQLQISTLPTLQVYQDSRCGHEPQYAVPHWLLCTQGTQLFSTHTVSGSEHADV